MRKVKMYKELIKQNTEVLVDLRERLKVEEAKLAGYIREKLKNVMEYNADKIEFKKNIDKSK